MKTCPSCRQALPEDAKFCPIDGASLAGVAADPLLGSVLADRYVLLERVGQGNSGTIYRAEHVVLRQKIAVKLLHPELSSDQAAVDRFRQEAMTLAQLQSESIVRVSDFGVAEDGRVFFAMEFLEGEILAAALGREGRFAEERAVALLKQVGSALAEGHALGFVHRDIRPRNIFFSKQPSGAEQVKLLDFGLAKLVDAPKGERTTLGHTLGDPRYLSPEQARGDTLDARSDIYSLAIIAYELASGSPPFCGSGTVDVLTKHLEAQPVPLREKAPEISPAYAEAVTRALSKRVAERPPTVEAFLSALEGKPIPAGKDAAPVPAAAKGPLKDGKATTLPLISKGPASGQQPAELEPAKTLLGTGLSGQQVLAATGGASAAPKADAAARKAEAQEASPAPAPAAPAPAAPAPAAPAPAAEQAAKDPRATDPSVPEFHLPSEAEIKSPYQEDQASESSNWFAQGMAAEHALEAKTSSGPLPSLYEAFDEDEEVLARRFSPSMVIAAVVATVALVLFLVIFTRGSDETSKESSAAAGQDEDQRQQLQQREPSAFRGGGGTPPASAKTVLVKDSTPSKQPPVKQPAVKQPPVKQAAVEQAAVKQAAVEQAAVKQAAVEQPPVKQPAVKQPAVKQPRAAAAGKGKEQAAATQEAAKAQVKEGQASLRRADYASARQSFNKALQLDASQTAAHTGLGEVAFELGHYAVAAKHFNTALRNAPRNTRSLVMLGNTYFKLGRFKDAVEQYRRALKIDPNNAAAQAGMQAAVRRLAGESG